MAQIKIDVTADPSRAVKGIKEVNKALDGMGDHAAKAGKSGTQLTSILGEIAGGAGLTLGIAGVTTGLVSMGAAVVKAGMAAEQTEMAFATLLGSTAAAQQHLTELRDFAAKTPFEFTQLTDSSRKLQAFGFAAKDIVPMLTDIGDAVSAMGGNAQMIDRVTVAIGQMSAKGKIQAGEMLQLTEAGIPAWRYLAESMGMTTAEVMKLSEKGLIPAQKGIDAILAGMRQDFGGMMAEQATTATGKISNLTDAITRFQTVLGSVTTGPVGDLAAGLADIVNVNATAIESFQRGDITIDQVRSTLFKYQTMQISAADAIGELNAKQIEQQERMKAAMEAAQGYNEGLSEAERISGLFGNTLAEEVIPPLDNLTDASSDLKFSMSEVTKGMIFQAASAEMPAEAALELARAMGLLNEQAFSTKQTLDELRSKYDSDKDGAISAAEAARGYTRDVAALGSAVERLPKDTTVNITTILTEVRRQAMDTLREKTGTGRQHGGPVMGGSMYLVGERGPEYFIPASNGRVTPMGDVNNTNMGGVTIVINGSGNPQAVAAEVRRQLDASGRSADGRIRMR